MTTGTRYSTKPSADASVGSPITATATLRRVAPAVPRPPAVPPALARLRTELGKAFAKAGPDAGALVYDLTAKQTLFAVRADEGRPPASVEKLYTTVALLSELGPDFQLTTTVLGDGHLGPGGVWHGDLYLRGGGDPTLGDGAFNRDWEEGYGPTANQLVGQLNALFFTTGLN